MQLTPFLRFPRAYLKEAGRVRRPGFAAAVLAIAKVDGDHIEIHIADWHRLTVEFADRGFRLGDALANVAKPTGRLIDRATAKLPKRYHTHFGGTCIPCNQRQAKLNAADATARAWLARTLASVLRLFKRPQKRPSRPV